MVVIVLSKRAHLREEGLQCFRVLLIEYGVVNVVVLNLVAHALELPVPARLITGEVAGLEDLRAVLLLVLLGHAVKGEQRDAELPVGAAEGRISGNGSG